VDRVTVRSFRAHDLAERGLKELAKSRLDTTRDVVFQPLGARFFEVREDAARLGHLFREDAFHAPNGHFLRMTLRVEPPLSERLAHLEPRAVERRLEDATRDAILREVPRAQGVYLARFEPSARDGLEPVVHVQLSCRRLDGGPNPALTRDDARRFETAWNREVGRAFGLSREPARAQEREPAQDRASVLGPEIDRLRQEWARASARLFAVHAERLHGRATQQELVDAVEHARAARAAWSRSAGRPVNLRDVGERQVFDVVQLRIEGGSLYLRGELEAHRRTLLETAASRAAGLPDGPDRQVAVVAWPAGRDLHATVYFNQRSGPERPPDGIEPARLRATLEEGLRDEILRLAPSFDPAAAARTHELGPVEARLPERAPAREPVPTARERLEERAPSVPAAALVVKLDREEGSEARAAAAVGGHEAQDALDRLQPGQRDWTSERVFAVRLRVPTGAEQLERGGLSAEETAHVIQRAVDRAYPFLEREGIRNSFLCAARGRALDVQIVIPERLGWTPSQLRSPQFHQRFLAGFHQALSRIEPTRLGPGREPLLPGLARGAAVVGHAPRLARQAEHDPEQAARGLACAVFSKLSEALPKPFRLMRELGRTVGRFVPRGE
jgi:hypothetical protein